jgi:hypothetical protein
MNKVGSILCSILCFIPVVAGADQFSGKDSMNDVSFKTYKDFNSKWPLTTIRFRKDTGEMRVVYANEIASKALHAGSINYPDGAVFAKIGFHTTSDPQFDSSLLPNGVRRYQFMVRNKEAYKNTGGWGYAIFDENGLTFPEDPKVVQDACYACHSIVDNRGGVFSTFISAAKDMSFKVPTIAFKVAGTFKTFKISKLPQAIRALLPLGEKQVRWLENEKLRLNLFQGTLDEVKPLLLTESMTSNQAAIFTSADTKRWVMVVPKKLSECSELMGFEIHSTILNGSIQTSKQCQHD